MSLPIVLTPEARAEFDDGFDWYEAQKPGLGVDFAERLQDVFDAISANPHRYAAVFQDVRKVVVQRFPYCVFYRAEASRVLVLAVFHSKRDPRIWQGRA